VKGLWLIARRSLRQHALATAVTVFSVALAVGLVMSVFTLSKASRDAFTGGDGGFDAVLGARGSPVQLVLNTVFHLETSPGNVPWAMYDEIRNHPAVESAVPYAVGDNLGGFRIVGTTPELFDVFLAGGDRKLAPRNGGRVFDPARREAVIGHTAAIETGLRVGATFHPVHDVGARGKAHDTEYTVVGILEQTGAPVDRVLFIPIEGAFRMDGHELRGTGAAFQPESGQAIPDEHKEVSAVMLRLRAPAAGLMLAHQINRQGKAATLAWPVDQIVADLFNKLAWVAEILRLVAYLVMVVAAFSILASLYNTMNERRREFAILRALGARRRTVFGVIVLESATIAFLGALLGYAVYVAIVGVAAAIVRKQTGVVIEVTTWHPALWGAPLGMTLLGAAAGLLPAFKAYSTDVAPNLLPTS